jgi:hypothetical protein
MLTGVTHMPLSNRLHSKGIGYYLLKFVFPIIYALTATYFTVLFFRRFVPTNVSTSGQSASTPASLFNLFPLDKVNEFFLPLLVLSLEFLSIQLAVDIWIHGFAGNRRRVGALCLLFLCFQSFPVFSTFFDARTAQLSQLQDKSKQDVQSKMSARTAQEQALQQLIDQRTNDINAANQDIYNLTGSIYYETDPVARQVFQDQLNHESTIRDGYVSDQQHARQKLQDLTSSGPPAPDKFAEDSDLQYIADTAGTSESVLSAFVSILFPTVVFGAGYVLARSSAGSFGEKTVPQMDLREQLEACKKFPVAQQRIFANEIAASMEAYVNSLQTTQTMSRLQLDLNRRSADVLRIIEVIAGLQDNVNKGGASDEVRGILTDRLTAMLAHGGAV